MDRTLNHNKKGNARRIARNLKAWQAYSPDGRLCRFCPHDRAEHLSSSGQPHYFRLATEAEIESHHRGQLSSHLYSHLDENENKRLTIRVTVNAAAELITTFCQQCARDKATDQVICYQRTLAVGEVIGLPTSSQTDKPLTNTFPPRRKCP